MIVPYVVERTTGGGERALDVYSRLLADRIVYLGSPIDDDVANVVVAQLLHLESAEPGNPIDLYVNNILIARGEVVVVDDKYAVKISELNPQSAS